MHTRRMVQAGVHSGMAFSFFVQTVMARVACFACHLRREASAASLAWLEKRRVGGEAAHTHTHTHIYPS
jgi:hypothetical protein